MEGDRIFILFSEIFNALFFCVVLTELLTIQPNVSSRPWSYEQLLVPFRLIFPWILTNLMLHYIHSLRSTAIRLLTVKGFRNVFIPSNCRLRDTWKYYHYFNLHCEYYPGLEISHIPIDSFISQLERYVSSDWGFNFLRDR